MTATSSDTSVRVCNHSKLDVFFKKLVIAESEIAVGANIEKNGLEKGGFETTLTGMMEALEDIQTKGDLMMGAIRGQRELLFDVRGEVREARWRPGARYWLH